MQLITGVELTQVREGNEKPRVWRYLTVNPDAELEKTTGIKKIDGVTSCHSVTSSLSNF